MAKAMAQGTTSPEATNWVLVSIAATGVWVGVEVTVAVVDRAGAVAEGAGLGVDRSSVGGDPDSMSQAASRRNAARAKRRASTW